jgi:hypothetical protein
LSGSAASSTTDAEAVAVGEPEESGSYGAGARILTIGIASTGVFTFLYLALASHQLSSTAYGQVSLLWSVMYVILCVIYRPIEQLLSRTIADRRARGLEGHPLRVPATIQLTFALLFLAVALPLRTRIETHLFGGSSALYWILVVGVLAYAGSYFARGWLAGHERFALYGGLVFLESTSRLLFALAAVIGISSGQSAIALGMAVAPFVSLCVVPFALGRVQRASAPSGARRGRGGTRARRDRGGCRRPLDRRWIALRGGRLRDHAVRADADERGGADRQRQVGRGARRLCLQRADDRARALAAVPGDPDVDPAPPDRAHRARERTGVRRRDP